MQGNNPSILIAASGSGGHLMPAKMIARALIDKGADVSFVGSGRPLEEEILGELGIPIYTIPLGGVHNLGVVGLLKFLLKLPYGVIKALEIFRKSSPKGVVGVGGYASVLPIILGSFKRLPTWIHEAELSPGTANRYLSRFASVVSVAFKEAEGFCNEKRRFTGHPIRRDVADLASEERDISTPKKLLVLGGSQGAKSVDNALKDLAPYLKEKDIELYHQCRPENLSSLEEFYSELGLNAKVAPFIQELGEAYRWSDLIIARAGAGTVMEIGAVNRPTIFIPFPHAQGKHQHKNARTLVSEGKALMVEEGEEFTSRLKDTLDRLLQPEVYREMVEAKGPERPLDAAERIAGGILELVEKG